MNTAANIAENNTMEIVKKTWTTPNFEIIHKNVVKSGANTGTPESTGSLHTGTYFS